MLTGQPQKKATQRIGSLEGQDLFDKDYDIDDCNGEILELFEKTTKETTQIKQKRHNPTISC